MSSRASRLQDQVDLMTLQSLRKLKADDDQKQAFAYFLERKTASEIATEDLKKSVYSWTSLWESQNIDPVLLGALKQKISENQKQVKNCDLATQNAETSLNKAKIQYVHHCEIETEFIVRSKEYARKAQQARDDHHTEFLSIYRTVTR